MPLISVIVPVYNVEKYIHRCIDSILYQSFCDFELILIDDGSPDNCGTICDEYANKDKRIHVIHQKNQGLSAARNSGINWAFNSSDTDWITFIDSDDWIHNDYLQILLNEAVSKNVGISICGYYKTNGEIPEINISDSSVITPEEMWCNNQTNATIACGKLYKKDLFSEIRYPIGKIHEDEFTTYKLLFKCDEIAYTPSKLYFYYQNPTSITNTGWNQKKKNVINAFRNQIIFFRDNHFQEAKKVSSLLLINTLCSFLTQNNNLSLGDKLKIKAKLGYNILKLKKDLELNVIKDYWAYSKAFPVYSFLFSVFYNKIMKRR